MATCATYSLWNSSVKAKGGSEWRPGTASQPYSLIMMSFRKERLVRVKGEVRVKVEVKVEVRARVCVCVCVGGVKVGGGSGWFLGGVEGV